MGGTTNHQTYITKKNIQHFIEVLAHNPMGPFRETRSKHFLSFSEKLICNSYASESSIYSQGEDGCTKSDEFSETFQKGMGGLFSIQKFILQILGTLNRAF